MGHRTWLSQKRVTSRDCQSTKDVPDKRFFSGNLQEDRPSTKVPAPEQNMVLFLACGSFQGGDFVSNKKVLMDLQLSNTSQHNLNAFGLL